MLIWRAMLFLASVHIGGASEWEILVDNRADHALPVYLEMPDDTCWSSALEEKQSVPIGQSRYFDASTGGFLCFLYDHVAKFVISQGLQKCRFSITEPKADREKCKFEIEEEDTINCHKILQAEYMYEGGHVVRIAYGRADCKEHKAYLYIAESDQSKDQRTNSNSKILQMTTHRIYNDGWTKNGYFLETALTKNISEVRKEFQAKSYISDTGLFFGKYHHCSAKVPLYYKFYDRGDKYVGKYSRTEYAKDTHAFTGIIGYCVPTKDAAKKCCPYNHDKSIHGVYYSSTYQKLYFLNAYDYKSDSIETHPKCYVWNEDHCKQLQ